MNLELSTLDSHFKLINIYGGVPLISEVYTLDDDYQVARNTYEESVNFILEDIDKAISLLPLKYSGINIGRITKGAAMALKSRVLLYAASDLHNINIFSDYKDQSLLRYTDNNRQARWLEAQKAAKDVIDLNIYNLYNANPINSTAAADGYFKIFINKDTEEDIFVKYFTVTVGQRFGLYTSPNGYHGWGANAPIGNLVDDYEMLDGNKFDWNNAEHASNPYENRDPRFYATILYNEAPWRPRPDDVKGFDPENKIQTGRKEIWNSSTNSIDIHYGVDTRKSTIEDWNGSETGYYCKKYLDPNNDAQYVRQSITWRFFRYAEILLNYAEACIELGDEEEAKKYINMVRARVNLPPISEKGEALRARYRNERRIEFAFEDHRFFDVRRWAIGEEAYQPALSADIIYKLNNDKTTSIIPIVKHQVFENRKWDNKMYFFPIMRDEMNKNSQLIQNPGY